jgi:FixJ family two-component response regulator
MSAHAEATVYVIDDDHTFRDALRRLLSFAGHRVALHANAESFLAEYSPPHPGCVILETRLPGMSGIELQSELRQRAIGIPLVFATKHGDIPLAVAAVKSGAVEFFEKPVNEAALLAVIEKTLKLEAGRRREHARKLTVAARFEKLTSREREIMHFVIAGKMNKTVADELFISIKTVEAHRAKVMQKLGVDSVAELVQLAIENGQINNAR